MKTFKHASAPEYILTAQGQADFYACELENAQGRWNDGYSVRDGYYVIHYGNEHWVYRLQRFDRKVK